MASKNKKPVNDPFADVPDMPAEPKSTIELLKKKTATAKPRKGLGEELIEVYENSGEDFRVISAFEHKARHWQRLLVWLLAFVVCLFIGVAAVSYYIWGRQPLFDGDDVVFELQAPEETVAGSLVTYVVHYANREGVSFSKSEVELRYPAGFTFVSANPEPLSGQNLFGVGSVAAMQEGTIEVQGYLVGRPEQEATLSGVWRYWPSNFSSEFQEVASARTVMKPVNIEARLEGPDQVLVGQRTTYTLIYNNISAEAAKDLRWEVIYPEGFIFDASKPELADDNKYFVIAELPSNQEQELQINGFYSQAPEQPVDFHVELALRGGEDDYFTQKQISHTTKVIRGDLAVNLIANGTNKDGSLQWGDVLQTSIAFQNNSEATLSDLTVVARLESRYRTEPGGKGTQGALDWSTLIDSAAGSLKEVPLADKESLRVRTITWTGDDVAALDTLEPKEEGTIDFQINLYDLAQAAKQIAHPDDVEILLGVEISVGKTGGVQEQLKVVSNPIRFVVNTDLAVAAQARYFDESGNQVGAGPLPPEVGEKTKYRLYWTLTNSLHEVSDVLVSTDLPDNVSWLNAFEVSAGEVIFTATSNTLSWRLNRMPIDIKELVLSFDVEVSPTQQQVGKTAPLTKKITLTGTDAETGGKIIETLSALSTGVEQDEEAADRGIVVN